MDKKIVEKKAVDLLKIAKENMYFEDVISYSALTGCDNLTEYDNFCELTEFARFDDEYTLTRKAKAEFERLQALMRADIKAELGFYYDDELTDEQYEQIFEFINDWHDDGTEKQVLSLEIHYKYNDWYENDDIKYVDVITRTTYTNAPYYTGGEELSKKRYKVSEFMELKTLDKFKQQTI